MRVCRGSGGGGVGRTTEMFQCVVVVGFVPLSLSLSLGGGGCVMGQMCSRDSTAG